MRGHSKCIGRVVAMTSATGYDQFIKECSLLGDLLSTRFLMYIKRLSVHNYLKRYIYRSTIKQIISRGSHYTIPYVL